MTAEETITDLRDRLLRLQRDVIWHVYPPPLRFALWWGHNTDAAAWYQNAIRVIVEHGRPPAGDRAACPLCHAGQYSDQDGTPRDWGYRWPAGLEHHLKGQYRVKDCYVFRVAQIMAALDQGGR